MPHVRQPSGGRIGVQQCHDPVFVTLVEHVVGRQHTLPGSDTLVLIDAFQAVLRGWPRELELTEHLRAAYTPALDSSSDTDIEAVLAVVRMTHDEPALRAVHLMLRERSEQTFAEVLADRMAVPPDSFEVRVHAAAMNAVLKVASDHLAAATANERLTSKALDRHRQHIADAVSLVIHGLPDRAGT